MVARNSKNVHMELMNLYEKPNTGNAVAQQFPQKIQDRKERSWVGKTARAWKRFILFYLVFFGVLAALISIYWKLYYLSIDLSKPKWMLEESLIGANPGMGFRPTPDEEQSSLIWIQRNDSSTTDFWVASLNKFVASYKDASLTPGREQNLVHCDYNHPPPPGKVCNIDMADFGPCTSENRFAYTESTPCVFLKLNNIYGWKPIFYADESNLPSEMPQNLKDHIKKLKATNPVELNTIWVSCEGERPIDKEYIGEIEILPRPGFPGYFYPFKNTAGFLNPIVALRFKKPMTGYMINVMCKAWAQNIKHHREDMIGSVHLELLID